MLGVSPATYTFWHALISLIAIGSGLIIMFGFLIRRKPNALIFNLSDHHGVDERDPLWFSIRSMFAVTHHRHPLVAGVGTRDSGALRFSSRRPMALGRCRRASTALSRNAFVLIVQLLLKVPALKALAPTRKEPPFLIAQLSVMASFIALTIPAAGRFHLEPTRSA